MNHIILPVRMLSHSIMCSILSYIYSLNETSAFQVQMTNIHSTYNGWRTQNMSYVDWTRLLHQRIMIFPVFAKKAWYSIFWQNIEFHHLIYMYSAWNQEWHESTEFKTFTWLFSESTEFKTFYVVILLFKAGNFPAL